MTNPFRVDTRLTDDGEPGKWDDPPKRFKIVRCPEVVTEQGDQCIKIIEHIGFHEIDLSKRPPYTEMCLWCGQHVQINPESGACLACGEMAHKAAEASTFLGWFCKAGLIIVAAMTVGAMIQLFR